MLNRFRSSQHSRGQALVELAIILPLLVLMLVMAIDAGRLFFGWVALHNAARIGADYAAANSGAWDPPTTVEDQEDQDRYATLISQDLQAMGCNQVPADVPEPNFDPDGDGTDDFADGSLARVELDCDFVALTPLVGSFLGNPLTLHARSDFPINSTISAGLPPPGNPPPQPPPPPGSCTAPDFVGPPAVRKNNAQALWTAAGFTTTLTFVPNNGNYFIVDQAPLNGGQSDVCSTPETVSNVVIP